MFPSQIRSLVDLLWRWVSFVAFWRGVMMMATPLLVFVHSIGKGGVPSKSQHIVISLSQNSS